jgi:hypothetical protein
MKRLPFLPSLLLAAGLVLATSASAQNSSGSSAGSRSPGGASAAPGIPPGTPPPSGPLDPTPPPVSPLPSDPRSDVPGRDLDRPNPRASVPGSVAEPMRVDSTSSPSSTSVDHDEDINPGLPSSTSSINQQFNSLDSDGDSRLSLSEFLAGSVAAPSSDPRNRDRTPGPGSSVRSNTTTSTTSGRTGSDRGVGVNSATSADTSSQFTTRQFQMLDTNHDGYLSHSEVRASPGVPRSGRP